MTDLLLTIICSTSIALILKHNDTRQGPAIVLLAGNYLVAAILALIYYLSQPARLSLPTFFFGAALGLLFVYSFFAFTRAIRSAGTALATVSSRLSVIIPVLLSILIFSEYPGTWQGLGLTAAGITFYFFYRSLQQLDHKRLRPADYFYLLVLLIGIGINDFSMKVFNQWRPAAEKPFFLLVIFASAFFYSMLFIFRNRVPVHKKTFLLGNILGLPNVFSSWFLLGALAALPAIIVYPAVNIGIIVLTAALAAVIWHEKLNIYGQLALVSGLAAIVMLNLH